VICAGGGRGLAVTGAGSLRRLRVSALTATMRLDPDMAAAAMAGLRENPSGAKTPAAMGMARLL
jgi:hypothetical protein